MDESKFQIDKKMAQGFTLEKLVVTPSKNQIAFNDQITKVQPKAMSVLAYLALNSERVISSDELIETLWKGRIVTQNSVQKSINTLRKILAVFFIDQVVIENYSKKGYQLKISPVFIVTETDKEHNIAHSFKRQSLSLKNIGFLLGLVLVVGLFSFYQINSTSKIVINKLHNLEFTQLQNVVNTQTYSHNLEVHPNNKALAYVNNNSTDASTLQTLMVKQQDKNWRIASTQGTWTHLAWSPNGSQLVAIEQQGADSQPTPPSFYAQNTYLYTFHIFTLDLEQQRLVEKQLLSQWHGQVNSITWINDQMFEFIASQGNTPLFQRFRYEPDQQSLNIEDTLDFAPSPFLSKAFKGNLAILSQHKNGLKVDFIGLKGVHLSSWPLEEKLVDISWIPDGSGVLIHSLYENKLEVLYLDGERKRISLENIDLNSNLHPRFSPDAHSLYFVEYKAPNSVWSNSVETNYVEQLNDLKESTEAHYSPSGNQVIQVVIQNNKTQLWLTNTEQQVTAISEPTSTHISDIFWQSETEFIYKSGSDIYQYKTHNNDKQLLLANAHSIKPVAFQAKHDSLITVVNNTNTANIWKIDLKKNKRKQLTFGSVGTVIATHKSLYFQYIDQKGLWSINLSNDKIFKQTNELPTNSKALYLDETSLYFINGYECHESDIYQHSLQTGLNVKYLEKKNKRIKTFDYHPNKGDLHTKCKTSDSKIMQYK